MTYSIVARDAKTGEMGVAVQSHYFSVGSVVTWARAGVGAVATQANAEVSYGPLGLELMAAGKSAPEALQALLMVDAKAEHRQVAMVDRHGNTAAHTGKSCIPHAGHVTGDGFSCQGNIMRNSTVWGEMKDAYLKSEGQPLAERLVGALEAAEAAGGDVRGRQSSAILVVSGDGLVPAWSGRVVELRVEDNPEPNLELKRLLRYHRGYEWEAKGDDLLSSGDVQSACKAYERALEIVPEVDELKYWVGITLLTTNERQRGLAKLREVFVKDPSYVQLTKTIMSSGAVPIDPSIREIL